MAVRPDDVLRFPRHLTEEAVALMTEVMASRDGWLVFVPGLEEEETPPPRSGLFGLFSGRGPDVVEISWVPGKSKKDDSFEALNVGIRHPHGPGALERLAKLGHEPPEGWRVWQDHGKRGIVMAIPDDALHEDVLAWFITAAVNLSRIDLPIEWLAVRYLY